MFNHITGIDHVLIAVRDLEAAAQTFSRLGFTVTPRGIHPEWGTSNYCLMFGAGYMELLGATGEGVVADRLNAWLDQHGEGLMGLAFTTPDGAAACQDLRQAGIDADMPRSLSRKLLAPEGELVPMFSIVDLPPAATPGITAILCQHLTPDMLRRPQWMAHPNGAAAIASVTAVVDCPEADMGAWTALFGPGAVTPTDNTLAVHTGSGLVLLSSPDDLTQLHPEADLDPPPRAPALVALTIAVADTDRAANALEDGEIPFSRDSEGSIRVAPTHSHGVMLELVQAR